MLTARRGQHRTRTPLRPTAAGIVSDQFGSNRVIDSQSIGDTKLVARPRVSERFDKNPPPLVLDRLTVRLAGVVQPAGAVASDAAVDHAPVNQSENERVAGHAGSPVPGRGPSPRCHLTAILEDPLAGWNRLQREHASPVNR